MFEIKNLSIQIRNQYFIRNLSLTLNAGDKLAIIGEEGNGKSTLLKVILGICPYAEVEGTISSKNHSIGYLPQMLESNDLQKTGYEYLFKSSEDYYNQVNFLYQNLERLHIDDSLLERTLSCMSGGEKVKLSILKLLLEKSDILFLDEPTNDLDIETLEWLEHFIVETKCPVVYVSHDETLLSHTANCILHLERIYRKTECKHTFYRTTYDDYVRMRRESLAKETMIAKQEQRDYQKREEKLRQVMQKVEYQQNTISRSDPHGGRLLKKKMHSLKSQERKLHDTNLAKVPDVEEGISFRFEDVTIPRFKKILTIDIPTFQVDTRVLATNLHLEVMGNEKVCIIGSNGIGKSTFLKTIHETLRNRSDIRVGYMPQNYEDAWDENQSVLEFLSSIGNKEEMQKAMTYLGNMKFTVEEMNGSIRNLSGGSKAKLLLTRFVLEKVDVLLLDEPTRNVSPLSNPIIRDVLRKFQGTIISVSHDRKYISEVATRVYRFTKNGLVLER